MEPFIGQIQAFGFNFAPRGWAQCQGQLLAISQYTALFSLLGTTFGGDGRVTFQLPDLRGRMAMHPGTGAGLPTYRLGQKGGNYETTLALQNLPSHTHPQRGAEEDANSGDPGGNVPATTAQNAYHGTADTNMGSTAAVGNSTSFSNQPPYLGLNFIMAIQGTFPSR